MPNFSIAAPYSRGKLLERILAQLLRPEVDEVIGILLPAQDAEEIRIDHAHHQFVLC
jgi:hypothetical protein